MESGLDDWRIHRKRGNQGKSLVLNGQGLTNPYTRDMRWESVSVWKSGAAFTPVESSTEVRDMQGKLVMTERKDGG